MAPVPSSAIDDVAQVPVIDARARSRSLDQLESERFDLAIIGGGITGAGLAREASQRGLRVALLEADDFAAGTSSRSSKLIHGGLRYLAMGDVSLVRATALERKVVHRIAPHLAEPRWMLMPLRSRASLAKIRFAVTTYERLGAVAAHERHRNLSRQDLAIEEPLLRGDRLPYACIYREYLTDDARLVLANLRSAVADGAIVLNHARVEEISIADDRASGVIARCSTSGRQVEVRARCVINAAGPWVDAVRALEDKGTQPRLHLSKGVHIVIDQERLPVRNIVVCGSPDKRSVFAIRRGSGVYIGTTDTSYPRCHTWPHITRADVDYLLAPLNRSFDIAPLGRGDVVAAWAGLRPLIAQPGKKAREISRKDEVWIGARGVVTIAGGKLTGYRPMARMALERAAESAGLRPAPAPAEDPPLIGGDFTGGIDAIAAGTRAAADGAIDAATALRMAALYGSETADVVALGAQALAPGACSTVGEVDWAVTREGACTVEDVVYRRTRLALYEPADRVDSLEAIAHRMAELLGWSDEQRDQQQTAARARLAADLDFSESES